MIRVGIVGGSGYTGRSLLNILEKHPQAQIAAVVSRTYAGKKISEVFSDYQLDTKHCELDYDQLNQLDCVILAVPHGAAKEYVKNLNTRVIDLTGDHRLTHTYGMPEIFKDEISTTRILANPGCYATSCILSTYPIKDKVEYAVFDSVSGYSGGGRNKSFDVENNILAYKLTDHHHNLEMDRILPMKFSFTPHVINAFRGIMTTAHLLLKETVVPEEIIEIYKDYYQGSLTEICDTIPSFRDVADTSKCLLGGFKLDSNGNLVIISVIDNLLKGAASQAIENFNLMFGLESQMGLKEKIRSFTAF